MCDGMLPDGTLQCFYFPADHKFAGQFKGMATILEEHGIDAMGLKLQAQCGKSSFKCCLTIIPPGANPCCCRKALYDQPDFSNQKSHIEELIESCGHQASFYACFHCECNFVENNWGYSKCIDHEFPQSSNEADLERNVVTPLDSVPMICMCW
jgi:hypothetical protein